MEVNNRKSIWEKMKIFDPSAKEDSFIEVTEWTNGEGWDITIDNRQFSLSWDELNAINYLSKHIEYNERMLVCNNLKKYMS